MNDSLQWLFGLEVLGMKFGLENMSKLMGRMGDPHRAFRSVHVAGTNGKGSVTAIVDEALRAAGYRSARYTSPHLVRLEERYVVHGAEVGAGALSAAVDHVRSAAGSLEASGELGAPPTFFECATAAAFDLFRTANVDIAVVEVGLGGRLDATNVLSPLVSAITTIDFDHQAQLGNTLESIAAEKAGVIKPSTPVVIGRLPGEAERVIQAAADAAAAPLVRAIDTIDLGDLTPALPGDHQRDNAAVALAVIDVLRRLGLDIPRDAARFAVEHVQWPARLERIRSGQADVIVDAAHNPAGARALASYLQAEGWTDATLVFGAMGDKDVTGMLRELLPHVARAIVTHAPSPRARTAGALAADVRSVRGDFAVDIVPDPEAALRAACASSARVVVAGSIFLAGPLRGILR